MRFRYSLNSINSTMVIKFYTPKSNLNNILLKLKKPVNIFCYKLI